MNKHLSIKSIVLFLSWLTLSPFLLILDGRWKLLPKWLRIVLFVLSPMMLIIVVVLALLVQMDYSYYSRRHFVKSSVIENMAIVQYPTDFYVREMYKSKRTWKSENTRPRA